jgi:hypothetical protein
MKEGFRLDPSDIAEDIHSDLMKLTGNEWNLRSYIDSHIHPDFETEMTMVADPVDRAVVVFIGPREQAKVIYEEAKKILV